MTHASVPFGRARLLCAVYLCGLTLSAALAQGANTFNGKWTATFANGRRSAAVVIAEGGGSWMKGRVGRLQVCGRG